MVLVLGKIGVSIGQIGVSIGIGNIKIDNFGTRGEGEVVWGICARSRMQCFGIGICIGNIGIGEIDVIKLVKLVLVLVLEISNF